MAMQLMLTTVPISASAQNTTAIEPYSTGMENEVSELTLKKIAGYDSGMSDEDGGVMEIVAYNDANGYAYSVNGKSGKLISIPLTTISDNDEMAILTGSEIDVAALITEENFTYGDMTSVAVSKDGASLAVAVQAEAYDANGRVVVFQCNEDGTLTYQTSVEVGVQPDMVTFTPDGTKILTANEGEPRNGYGEGIADPAGTISIITVSSLTVHTAGFESYDNEEARAALVADGIIIKKDTNPSVDFEPEYIACTNTKAYITLQEANAIAVLSLESNRIIDVYSVGYEDYSKVAVDIDKGDENYVPVTYNGLYGIRMPDGISMYTMDGADYLLTANEGDSREWDNYCNEKEVKKNLASPAGNIAENTISGKVVYFDTTDYDGLDTNKDYLFGGRSFTVFKVTETGLEEVFDSGNDFEYKTNKYFPAYFNCSNDDLTKDNRSGKKGPEPETVIVGNVDGKIYAFISLERIGGIMVYDITDPGNIVYSNYINSRDFSADVAADDSPEGLCFVSAKNSPTGKAMLLAACEVGGTVAVYETVRVMEPVHTHTYENIITQATTLEDGSIAEKCNVCGNVNSVTKLNRISSVTLSDTKYVFDNEIKNPSVKVQDSMGNMLKKDIDYIVSYEKECKDIGSYKVMVVFQGNYAGSKELTFEIVPQTPGKLTVTQTSNTIKANWKQVSGVTGYEVCLYKGNKLVKSKITSGLNYTFKKLRAGIQYTIKVKAYKTVHGTNYWSDLKSLNAEAPVIKHITAGKKKITLKWSNISGENGYQLYYAASKNGTYKKCSSYRANTTKATIKKLAKKNLVSGKTYYFKIKAYKKGENGTVYNAWSNIKKVKVK